MHSTLFHSENRTYPQPLAFPLLLRATHSLPSPRSAFRCLPCLDFGISLPDTIMQARSEGNWPQGSESPGSPFVISKLRPLSHSRQKSLTIKADNYGSMNNIQTADNVNSGVNHGEISQRSLQKTSFSIAACQEGDQLRPKQLPVSQVGAWGVVSLFNLLRNNFLHPASPQQEGNQSKASSSGNSKSIPDSITVSDAGSGCALERMDESFGSSAPSDTALHEVYVRTLLCSGYGLPCWEPNPRDPEAQPNGVLPGDVGTYTVKSGFKKTFNIWDAEASIQAISKASRTAIASQLPEREITTRLHALQMGEALFHGVRMSQGDTFGEAEYRFECRSSPGAVLALTSSANEEECERMIELERYIIQHAKAIYKHANGIRPIGQNDSLYIITGCTKSDTWAMAVYGECEPGRSTLQLIPERRGVNGDGNPSRYRWATQNVGSSRLRCSVRDSDVKAKNQTLFLQGFKLAFAPRFRSRMEEDDGSEDDPGGENPGDENPEGGNPEGGNPGDDNSDEGSPKDDDSGDGGLDGQGGAGQGAKGQEDRLGTPGRRSRSSGTDGDLPGRILLSREGPLTPATVSVAQQYANATDRASQQHHPSDAINAYLLHQVRVSPFGSEESGLSWMTDCDIAVTHDDCWRFIFKSALSDAEPGDVGMAIGDSMDRVICLQNGESRFPNTKCSKVEPLAGVAFIVSPRGRAWEPAPVGQSEQHGALVTAPHPVVYNQDENSSSQARCSSDRQVGLSQARRGNREASSSQVETGLPRVKSATAYLDPPPPPPTSPVRTMSPAPKPTQSKKNANISKSNSKAAIRAKTGCYTCRIRRKVSEHPLPYQPSPASDHRCGAHSTEMRRRED
ncbi:hypothetical protein NMY22_g10030 [Coprinellus aureogranulatus]|nr:hypothetical protein NMY22_g10030 [Coprinellus aureogranulatus]